MRWGMTRREREISRSSDQSSHLQKVMRIGTCSRQPGLDRKRRSVGAGGTCTHQVSDSSSFDSTVTKCALGAGATQHSAHGMQSDAAGSLWLVIAAAGVARTSGIAELDA